MKYCKINKQLVVSERPSMKYGKEKEYLLEDGTWYTHANVRLTLYAQSEVDELSINRLRNKTGHHFVSSRATKELINE